MKYDVRQLKLLSNEEIADGIFDMRLEYVQDDLPVSCGQFAHVYVPGKTLRRPISICDASKNVLRLVYQVKGEGTKIMSQMQPGYMVDVLVPLGNGFKIEQGRRCCLITDDGSAGRKGFVTDLLRERIAEIDEVCACGPTPMLKAVAAVCAEFNKPCQISLEERMGCGVGACLVCAVKVRKNGEEIMQHVCKNGPVFNAEEVVF